MFLAGAALGLLASQLGNVTMSGGRRRRARARPAGAGRVPEPRVLARHRADRLGDDRFAVDPVRRRRRREHLPAAVQAQVSSETQGGVAVVPVAEVPKIASEAGLTDRSRASSCRPSTVRRNWSLCACRSPRSPSSRSGLCSSPATCRPGCSVARTMATTMATTMARRNRSRYHRRRRGRAERSLASGVSSRGGECRPLRRV